MRNDILMIEFVRALQEKHPEIIFRFEYKADDDWYKIWHTHENEYQDDDFREVVGCLIKEKLLPAGMMNIYFDLNLDYISGMKSQKSWVFPTFTGASINEVVFYQLQFDNIESVPEEIIGDWQEKSGTNKERNDERIEYKDAA